jgi:hypothetical protein
MARYTWIDEISGTEVEVERKIADYDQPPQVNEIPSELWDKEKKWKRKVSTNIGKSRSDKFGTKGNW